MELINIYLILLLLYILTCLWVIKRYYKRELGAFQAPFIFSLASVLMMTPQFCVIIYNPYYDEELLWDLTYCMITCTLAFSFGWEKAQKKEVVCCKDLRIRQSRFIFLLFFIIGAYCTVKSLSIGLENRAVGGGDIRENHTFQVINFFTIYFDFSLFYSICYIFRGKRIPKYIYVILGLGSLHYLYVILVMARRAITVKLVMSLGLLSSIIRPNWANKIRIFVVCFFVLGTVYQASIGDIRANLAGQNEQIDIWENYKRSYYDPGLIHGMDLGNAAMFIKYVKDNGYYNGGLFLWDDIVSWYFPSFIFGKQGKENLKFANPKLQKYVINTNHAVTTGTGYYDAFAAWGYLGFLLFYILGYILGFIWRRASYSSLYLIVYLCFMWNIPNLASHGFSYVIGKIEAFILFCIPLIFPFIYNKIIPRHDAFHAVGAGHTDS